MVPNNKPAQLFEPLVLRKVRFKNRMAMAPMRTILDITEKTARCYFLERAKSGLGAVTTGATAPDLLIDDQSWGYPGSAARYGRRLKKWTAELHSTGIKAGLQLWHGNRYPAGNGTHLEKRGELVAPSPTLKARAMKADEIKNLVEKYAQAALKAKESGFDFVEIHGAHGYLLCQFFSPASNRRDDEYGGDPPRRMRFGLEIVSAVRQRVGEDFPLFYRLPALDFNVAPGITVGESSAFACALRDAGIDLISVSVGGEGDPAGKYDLPHTTIGPGADQIEGTYASYAGIIRKSAGIPVAAVGRFRTQNGAQKALVQGDADMIMIGRQLIAEPSWVRLQAENRTLDVTPCVSCNYCLQSRNDRSGVKCTVNGLVFNENKYKLVPAKKSKRIMIVGGGPAGLKAAALLAARGHSVTLYEKNNDLGGLLRLAALPPLKAELNAFLQYLIRQTEKFGVRIHLGTAMDSALFQKESPDVLLLATGSSPVIPAIPGVLNKNVIPAVDLLAAGTASLKKAVIIGGQSIACETADYLSEKGIQVALAAQSSELAADLFIGNRHSLLARLSAKKVAILHDIQEYVEITPGGLAFINAAGKKDFLEGDIVIPAVGALPNRKINKDLKRLAREVYLLGDCRHVGRIADAVKDGVRLGCSIA